MQSVGLSNAQGCKELGIQSRQRGFVTHIFAPLTKVNAHSFPILHTGGSLKRSGLSKVETRWGDIG